ncbi:MAG: sulfite exporter TauE/SafE family protein [Candidatus Eisenbacteria bacterium]|nr:sulfite exporter TauE/SafE family protein [Candidatus Eisenbacteria bacterium]
MARARTAPPRRGRNLRQESTEAEVGMTQTIGMMILGVVAGTLSGLAGVGGGVVIVPTLVLLFGMSQHKAQGTTLAFLIPPLMIVSAYQYWKRGDVDVRIAMLLAIGFVVGSYFGAKIALSLPGPTLKKVFGGFLFLVSLRYLLWK